MARLNIENDEAHRLASALSRITGESMTEAVTASLKERLERLEKQRSSEERLRRIDAITLAFSAAQAGRPGSAARELDDLLYDEDGLPH